MRDASYTQDPAAEQPGQAQDNLFLRGDTILGACEAVGRDFGFNPNWLRVLFAGAFYWNPAIVIGSYLALGLLVALSRLLFPAPALPHSSASAGKPAVPDTAPRIDTNPHPVPLAA